MDRRAAENAEEDYLRGSGIDLRLATEEDIAGQAEFPGSSVRGDAGRKTRRVGSRAGTWGEAEDLRTRVAHRQCDRNCRGQRGRPEEIGTCDNGKTRQSGVYTWRGRWLREGEMSTLPLASNSEKYIKSKVLDVAGGGIPSRSPRRST